MDFKQTLNLPDPDFTIPMKADLASREPEMLAEWNAMGIYERIQESRQGAETFILHDGPPYTNNAIHLGTAMNKILKDLVVKSRTMMGYRAPYVPGFDNHGLPIEQAVLKTFAERKETPSTADLVAACRAHAQRYVDEQTEQFSRLGVFGLWNKPYLTMSYRYEAELVRTFGRLAAGGLVYRGLRPVLWSPSQRTALADTEIEYKEVTSKAIIVKFPLAEDPHGFFKQFQNVGTLIWTTTPWTLPANAALAFHPTMLYDILLAGDETLIVLRELTEQVMETIGVSEFEILGEVVGESLVGCSFTNVLMDRPSRAVTAEYVTAEDGTGVVHTAPGHGRDDFYTGLRYELPILCPVDDTGVMTADAGEFAGMYYKDGDTRILDRLRELGVLMSAEDYLHSYPHSERDGKPVIFRTTEQWFISIDADDLRQRALSAIDDEVVWLPPRARERIRSMVAGRPDWCISRQRPWGVGIPVFYGADSGKPIVDAVAIEAVAQLVEREGSGAWFTTPAEEILPPGYAHPETGETSFRKETDILDVWFDSGASNLCVLDEQVEDEWSDLSWPADLYLEGSDQHRGWFNTSLLLGMGVKGAPPYRAVLTHGFIVDEQGRKMSKRLGNVVDPVHVCSTYGADILRYWVASVDFENDVPCSDSILKQFSENYRRIRNTLRFLLGNLYDYVPEQPVELSDLDAWIVEQTEMLCSDVVGAYERYAFNEGLAAVHNFCVDQLSSQYLDAIKDRMYCDSPNSPARRSAQAACLEVLNRLVRLVAPVLPFTAEEVYRRIPGTPGTSVHVETFITPTPERLEEIAGSPRQTLFALLARVRADAFVQFEAWKNGEGGVKDTQDAIVTIADQPEVVATLRELDPNDLANWFKMSWVELTEGEPSVSFRVSEYAKCERSRLRRPDVEPVAAADGALLTARDRRVLGFD